MVQLASSDRVAVSARGLGRSGAGQGRCSQRARLCRPRPLLSAAAPGLQLASARLTFQLTDPASPAESQLSEGRPSQPPAHCSRRPAPSPLCEAGLPARPAVLQRWRAQPPGAPAVRARRQSTAFSLDSSVTPTSLFSSNLCILSGRGFLSCVHFTS